MNKKIIKIAISLVVILVCFFIGNKLQEYGLRLQNEEFDGRVLIAFKTLINPLLLFVTGVGIAVVMRQFVDASENKVIFRASIILSILLLALLFWLFGYAFLSLIGINYNNELAFKVIIGIGGKTGFQFLLNNAAYLFLPLGIIGALFSKNRCQAKVE